MENTGIDPVTSRKPSENCMNCNIELCPDQCLVSVRFLHSAIMDCYFILRILPVPAGSISLYPCHCTCILSCGCVGVFVHRYCCGFRSKSLKIGYRTLNSVIHFWSLILVSIFFAWGLLQIFSKSFCCSYFVYSFLFGICLCRLLLWLVFVGRNGTTDFAKTGQVSDDTINLINC